MLLVEMAELLRSYGKLCDKNLLTFKQDYTGYTDPDSSFQSDIKHNVT